MRLGAFLAKDARLLVRHRALLAALLLYPFLLALVLGAAFQEPPTRLSLAVVDHDAGSSGVEVGGETLTTEDLLEAASSFADVERHATDASAIAAVRRGEVDAALLIPEDFLDDLSTLGTNATLRLVVDESDPVRAAVARNAVEGAVDAFVEEVVRKKIQDVLRLIDLTVHGGTTRVLFVDVHVLGIEGSRQRLEEVRDSLERGSDERRKVEDVLGFLGTASTLLGSSERYLTTTAMPLRVEAEGLTSEGGARLSSVALPGALVLGVFWTGALAAALLVARERETGAARRLAAAPRASAPAALSKALVALAAALAPALLLLALGLALLDAQVAKPLLALVVLALASLAAAGLGALAAGLARATSGAALLVVLLLLPMLLLGGLFLPVAYMPAAAQAVARVLPVTLATDALRGAMLRASPTAELVPALLGLAAFALVAGAAGAWLARRGAA